MMKPSRRKWHLILSKLKKVSVTCGVSCGQSKNQPFCDGSHQGTEFAPVAFVAEGNGHHEFVRLQKNRRCAPLRWLSFVILTTKMHVISGTYGMYLSSEKGH